MRTVNFDRSQDIPIIEVKAFGPSRFRRARLVFDTGAGHTQLDTTFIEELGYAARDASEVIRVVGPAGDAQEGYLIELKCLQLFGVKFESIKVGAYDFDNFDHYGIDGLLGFDVIKQLHLEMNGPEGLLKIF